MNPTTITKTYSELSRLKTFEERFEYLKLSGKVGEDTFGFERWMNQLFYTSPQWRAFRREVLIRDNGCDLGVDGFNISGPIEVHHINPITSKMIEDNDPMLMDMENVICVSGRTHRAIHYGGDIPLVVSPVERKPNDTCPWK